jgi:hypothetical protein
MPRSSTMNSWRFPPQTREVQVDEKWGFVAKKEKNCDPDDPLDRLRGDDWDHTAVDPESRLLLALVPGKRDGEACQRLINQVRDRTGGRTDLLITSDEHAPYERRSARLTASIGPGPDVRVRADRPSPRRFSRRCSATRRCGSCERKGAWWRSSEPWSSARSACWRRC